MPCRLRKSSFARVSTNASTMENRFFVGAVLVVCLTLLDVDQHFAAEAVDAKISFDSEDQDFADATTQNLEAVVDITNFSQEVRSQVGRPKTTNFGTRQRGFVTRTTDFKKRRRFLNAGNAGRTNVVNNIQIVVNGNGTESNEVDECQNGVCNVSVTSRPDGEGNIITDVRLTIVTNTNPNTRPKVNVNEVPVVDGFRGTGNPYEQPQPPSPTFHFVNQPNPFRPQGNVPQIRPRNYFDNGGTWYRNDQRPFLRPPLIFRYDVQQPKYDFRSYRPWQPPRSFVDDKIEPPLSKTKPNVEQ